jgi:uncharacterized protein involved in exopolysaccharide biosynthesis
MIGNNRNDGGEYADNFDVRASLRAVTEATRNHASLVMLTMVLTLTLVTVYILVWPPIYKAEATLMAERDTDNARDAFYTNWSIFRKDDAQTELELLKAGPVLMEVIEKEKLTYDDVYHPFFSHLAYVWRKSLPGRAYRAVKTTLFPNKDPNAPTEQEIQLGWTLVDMRAGISTEPVGETNVGKLTVKGPSARVGKVANTLINVYMEKRIERHHTEAMNSYEVLRTQATAAEKELNDIAQRRLVFAQERGVTFDFQKETLDVGKLALLEQDIAANRTKVATLEATLREYNKQLAGEPPTRTTLTVLELNSVREATRQKREELRLGLLHNLSRYREDAPEIRELKEDLAKLDAVLAETPDKVERSKTVSLNDVREGILAKRASLQADLEGSLAGLAVQQENAARMRKHLADFPAMQTTMRALDQEFALAQQKYNLLFVKQAEAAVSATTTKAVMPSVRVVDYAVAPGGKWWPSLKILYPSAVLVGLILGIAVALLKTYTSGLVTQDYVERRRGAVPFYGRIRVATGRTVSVAPPRENADSEAKIGSA